MEYNDSRSGGGVSTFDDQGDGDQQAQPCTPEVAANTSSCTFSSSHLAAEDEGMTLSQPSGGLSENVVSPPTDSTLSRLPAPIPRYDVHPLLSSLLHYTCFLSSGSFLDELPCALQQAASKLKTLEESSPLQVPSAHCLELEGVLKREFALLTNSTVEFGDFAAYLVRYVAQTYGLGAASCSSGFLLLIRYLMVSASLRNAAAAMAADAADAAATAAANADEVAASSTHQYSLQSVIHFQRDPSSEFVLGDVALQCIMIASTFFDSKQFDLDARMEKYRSHVLEALQYDIAMVSPMEYIGAVEVMAASEVAAAVSGVETASRVDDGTRPGADMTHEVPAAAPTPVPFASLRCTDDEALTVLRKQNHGASNSDSEAARRSLARTIAAAENIREIVATAKWCVMRVLCDAAAFGACSSSRLAASALAFSLIARTPPGDQRELLTHCIESHWDPEDLLFLRRVVQVFPAAQLH